MANVAGQTSADGNYQWNGTNWEPVTDQAQMAERGYVTTPAQTPYVASSDFGYTPNNVGTGPNGVQTTYNPQYYANDATAQAIAQQVGGTVVQGQNFGFQGSPGSPFSAPQTNIIQLPDGRQINAGLLAGYEQTYANNPQMLNALIQGELQGTGMSPQQFLQNGAPAAGTPWSGPQYQPPAPPAGQPPATGTAGAPSSRAPGAADLGTPSTIGPPGQGGPGGKPINPYIYGGSPIVQGGSGQPISNIGWQVNGGRGTTGTGQSGLPAGNTNPSPFQTGGTGTGTGTGTTPPALGGYTQPPNMPPFPGTAAMTIPTNTPTGPSGGAYPSFPTWGTQGGAGTTPYMAGDPGYMASSEANRAVDYGNIFQQNFGQAYIDAQTQARQYQDQADQSYNYLNQTPGYTTDEAGNIITGGVPGGLGSYMTTPEQFQANFLTPQEQAAMTGNPQAVQQAYNPATINTTAQQGADWTKSQYQNAYQQAQNALATGQATNTATLGDYGTRLRGIVQNPNLQMSDQEVQEMRDEAGRNIGLQYGASLDQMQRQAEAAGNVNPLALAAARDRVLRAQSIDQADAVTGADIAARGAQRAQATTVAGMQTGAESDIANANLATNLSQQGLQTGTAGTFGNIGANVGGTASAQAIGAGEFAGTTAINQAQYVDQAAQQRAAAIAQNRQTTAQANQAQGYQQGYYTNQANSQRYQGVAQQRIAGQQAVRNYYQGQGQYQGGQANQAATQQISGATASLGGMGQGGDIAARTEIGRRQNPNIRLGYTSPNISGVGTGTVGAGI